MDSRAIGIFDSGVGGCTVLKEIKKQLPNENYIYLGDTKRFPYGEKSKDEIIEYTKEAVRFFEEENVKVIIIACGTATSQALEAAQKETMIPVIGVIEPTAKYIKEKNYEKIGLIATNGSIRSKGWEKNIKKENENIEIITKACPLLAPLVEQGWAKSKATKIIVKEYLKDIKNVQAIVLGCTHYPIIQDTIKKCSKRKTEIINIGEYVAKELKVMLSKKNILNEEKKPKTTIYLTDIETEANKLIPVLLDEKVDIELLERNLSLK